MIHRTLSLLAGGLVLLLSGNVQALPITLATGESALFNFDLTTEGTAAFTDVNILFSVTGPDAGELVNFDIYEDLFGVGYVASFSSLSIGSYSSTVPDGLYAADGLFSFIFTAVPGPITLTEMRVTANDASGLAIEVDGAAVVPEPGMLLLLGLGLAGIGHQRRKQVRAA